jgi:hypothetical protein
MNRPRRTLTERLRLKNPDRFGGTGRPLPSTTGELTPDDWRIIRLALQTQVMESTRAEAWPKAEAAQRTLDKLADQ